MELPAVSHPDAARPAASSGLPSSPLVVGRAFLLGMILLIFVGYLTYCALSFGMNRFEDADAKRVKEREKILAERLSEDAKWLNDRPSWFKKDKGLVRVPIEEAMRLTVTELSAVAPHPADPIAANPAQPAAAPASPVAPATSSVPAAPVVPNATPALVAAPTPSAGAPVPLPGSTPEPVASPAAATPAPAPATAAPAPLTSPAPAPVPAPAGATPSPSPTDPAVTPGGTM